VRLGVRLALVCAAKEIPFSWLLPADHVLGWVPEFRALTARGFSSVALPGFLGSELMRNGLLLTSDAELATKLQEAARLHGGEASRLEVRFGGGSKMRGRRDPFLLQGWSAGVEVVRDHLVQRWKAVAQAPLATQLRALARRRRDGTMTGEAFDLEAARLRNLWLRRPLRRGEADHVLGSRAHGTPWRFGLLSIDGAYLVAALRQVLLWTKHDWLGVGAPDPVTGLKRLEAAWDDVRQG
jgi:hypothetical protein